MIAPATLILEPILKEKVWGGRRLEHLGKVLPPGVLIGESWEVADLASTAPGGGGGEAARSRIAGGPLADATLHDAMDLWGSDLMGSAVRTGSGGFPLLVKYLDACEPLSVQVHPSPAYALAHADAHLKTECWVVLDAEPGSVIFKGLRAGVGLQGLRGAIEDGSVPEVLASVPAVAGECHLLPSGTVHALGAGVLVAEVQTPSDTTFRVYDWAREYGRVGRELHIEQALASARIEPPPPVTRLDPSHDRVRLVETAFFTLDAVRSSAGHPGDIKSDARTPMIVQASGGAIELHAGHERTTLAHGQTAIVPASMGGCTIESRDEVVSLVTMLVGGVA